MPRRANRRPSPHADSHQNRGMPPEGCGDNAGALTWLATISSRGSRRSRVGLLKRCGSGSRTRRRYGRVQHFFGVHSQLGCTHHKATSRLQRPLPRGTLTGRRAAILTQIDPREHLAFYNPGLGSQPPGGALFITRTCRWLHKLVNQAPSRDLPTSSTAMPPSSRRSDLSCRGEAEVPFARQDF